MKNNFSSHGNVALNGTSLASSTLSSNGFETIDEKYKAATRLLLEIRDQMEKLETEQDASVIHQGQISGNINNLSRSISQLENMISQQPVTRREIWKIRIKQLADECATLRTSLGNYLTEKNKKKQEAEERARLLERRSKYVSAESNASEQLYREGQSISNSLNIAREIESTGRGIITSISSQNEQIKSIQKRIYDVAMTLGLSRSLMKIIERRQFEEKVLVYGGMILVLTIIFVLWYYV